MASRASMQLCEGIIGVLPGPCRKAFLHPCDYSLDLHMRAPCEEVSLPAEENLCPSPAVHSDGAVAGVEGPASVNQFLRDSPSLHMKRRSKLGLRTNGNEMFGLGHRKPAKFCEFVGGTSYASSGDESPFSGEVCKGLNGRSWTGSQGDLRGLDSRQKRVLVDRMPETFAGIADTKFANEMNNVGVKDEAFGHGRGCFVFRCDLSDSEEEVEEEQEVSDPSKKHATPHQHGQYAEVLEESISLDIHDAGVPQQSLSLQFCSQRGKEGSMLNYPVDNQSDKNTGNAGVLESPHQELENDRLDESKNWVDGPSEATLPQNSNVVMPHSRLQGEGQHWRNALSEPTLQTEDRKAVLGKENLNSVESFEQVPQNWTDQSVESLVRDSPPASGSSRDELPTVAEEESLEQEMIKEQMLRESPLSTAEELASASNRNTSEAGVYHPGSQGGTHRSQEALSSSLPAAAQGSESEGKESIAISSGAREPDIHRPRGAGLPPDVGVVIIDDEEEEEEDEEGKDDGADVGDSSDDTDSDAGSKRNPWRPDPVPLSRPAVPAARKLSDIFPDFSSSEDDSDSDDCQVLSWRPPQKKPQKKPALQTQRFWREPGHNAKVHGPESSQRFGREKESSDIEVMHGSQGIIRRQWEEAALKRRMGRAMHSEGSKAGRNRVGAQASNLGRGNAASASGREEKGASQPAKQGNNTGQQAQTTSQGLAESVATSTDSEDQTEIESRVRGESGIDVDPHTSTNEEQLPNLGKSSVGRQEFEKLFPSSSRGLQEVPVDIPNLFQARTSGIDVVEELDDRYPLGEPHKWMPSRYDERVTPQRIDGASTSRQDEFRGVTDNSLLTPKAIPDLNIKDGRAIEISSEVLTGLGLITEREKMKQSVEFQLADEEEWARRELELQRQAQEVQKLRKRKRAEADRKMEMENRQKQRLEEIRLLQQKEEWNMGLKEQLRGQVQKELESKASGCSDMATLLRRLGIVVEGGLYPSPQEVNAAYKKALLRFHPDRASALAQGDPRQQVQAEETFKLISRLKNTLSLVASPMFNPFR